jgi:hypothetical protein
MSLVKLNVLVAFQTFKSSRIKSILKSVRTNQDLLDQAFAYLGSVQNRLGFDSLTLAANVPTDPRGEIKLSIQLGNYGLRNTRQFDLTYSRKTKLFNINEVFPTLF